MNPDEDSIRVRLPSEQVGGWPSTSLRPRINEFMTREAQAMTNIKESPEVQKIKADIAELSGLYQKPQEFMSKFSKMDSTLQYHIVKTMFFPGQKEISNLGYRAEEYVVEFHDRPMNMDGSLNKPDFFVIDGSKLSPKLDERNKRLYEPELPYGLSKSDLRAILTGDEFNPKMIDTKLYLAFQAQMLDISDNKYMDDATSEGGEVVPQKWLMQVEKKSPLELIESNAKKIVEQAKASGLKLDKTMKQVADILWAGYTIIPMRDWIVPTDQIH